MSKYNMRKLIFLILLIVLAAIPTYSVSICSNGKCDAEENCSICPTDCGLCINGQCSYDNQCASGICCNNICQSSCVTYPEKPEPLIGWFKVEYATQGAIFLAGMIIVVGSLVIILKRR